MIDNSFEQIREFDRLEELRVQAVSHDAIEAGDLTGELHVLELLVQDSEQEAMPRSERFSTVLMSKIRRRKHLNMFAVITAMAAAFLVGLISLIGFGSGKDKQRIMVDSVQATHAIDTLTRHDMLAYLGHTEQLLMSMRDHEEACSEEGSDLALEKQLAKSLLMKQKRFSNHLSDGKYNQARALFASLESILVDVNGMDLCSDPIDLELINEHISKKRILGKLRLIAQEIQVS